MANSTIINEAKHERCDTILNMKARNHDKINTTINHQANNEKQKTKDGEWVHDEVSEGTKH